MSEVKDVPVIDTITPPSKIWRNWWQARKEIELVRETDVVVGDVNPGQKFHAGPYPSEEIARQRAHDDIARNAWNSDAIEYLGAFPDGESP